MLVDFELGNCRSFLDDMTLSAIASASTQAPRRATGRRVRSDADIAQPRPVSDRQLALLPALGVFGANASGKSNLVSTLDQFLSSIIWGGGEQYNVNWLAVPFVLSGPAFDIPTHLAVRIALNGNLYSYSLRCTTSQVFEEHLDYIPAGAPEPRLLFHRGWNPISSEYEWEEGSDFHGPHLQLKSVVDERSTFLNLIMRLDLPITASLRQWLMRRPPGTGLGYESYDFANASKVGADWPEHCARISELVTRFDTGIEEIEVRSAESDPVTGTSSDPYVLAWHRTKRGRVPLPFQMESTGTQRLFGLAHRILLALDAGTLLIVDELGSNLHAAITKSIIRLFQDTLTNPYGAQLVFTSHDLTLQKRDILRRDQIWFTQKRTDGSTELYPLSDFGVRNDLAIDKAYMDGRFGAVPILPNESELLVRPGVLQS